MTAQKFNCDWRRQRRQGQGRTAGLMGQDVTLFNRTFGHIEVIAQRGGIDLESPPMDRAVLAQ